jgi:predicted ArsR family transcriptional regulator
MLERFGKRQQELLKLMLKNKAGVSIDELAAEAHVTRTAVRQHLMALEVEGYVCKGGVRKTAGRPGQTFVLTTRGTDLFPKQYSWFSGLLLQAVKAERGSDGLAQWLRGLAGTIASSLNARLEGKDREQRQEAVVAILNDLAFEAAAVLPADHPGEPVIEASNCVYHELATQFPEVCEFDLELLSKLTGSSVDHQECMIRGGNVCRFRFS